MHLRFLFQTSLRLLKTRSSALGSESLGIRSKLFILEQLELVKSFQKLGLKYFKKAFTKKELPVYLNGVLSLLDDLP